MKYFVLLSVALLAFGRASAADHNHCEHVWDHMVSTQPEGLYVKHRVHEKNDFSDRSFIRESEILESNADRLTIRTTVEGVTSNATVEKEMFLGICEIPYEGLSDDKPLTETLDEGTETITVEAGTFDTLFQTNKTVVTIESGSFVSTTEVHGTYYTSTVEGIPLLIKSESETTSKTELLGDYPFVTTVKSYMKEELVDYSFVR